MRVTPRTTESQTQIPTHLVDLAKAWAKLNTGHTDFEWATKPCHYKVEATPEAVTRLTEYQKAINDQQIADDAAGDIDRAALWSRAVEKVSSLALLYANSRATLEQVQTSDLPAIELEEVNRAITVVDTLTRRTIAMATRHVGGSMWEGKLKQALVRLGSTRHSLRGWRKKCRHFEKGEFDIALRELLDAGRIERRDESTKGRSKSWVWRVGN